MPHSSLRPLSDQSSVPTRRLSGRARRISSSRHVCQHRGRFSRACHRSVRRGSRLCLRCAGLGPVMRQALGISRARAWRQAAQMPIE